MNQICDVGMPEHMGRNLKIQTVNHMAIVSCFFPKFRVKHILFIFSIYRLASYSWFCSSSHNVLPKLLELCIGQWLSIPIGNHIV